MKCPHCPVGGPATCLGESVARLCGRAQTRADYRRQLVRLAGEGLTRADAPLDLDAALGRVRACPDRGPVLPPALQPACGCAELTACRAGRGAVGGRVTVADCLACVAEAGA